MRKFLSLLVVFAFTLVIYQLASVQPSFACNHGEPCPPPPGGGGGHTPPPAGGGGNPAPPPPADAAPNSWTQTIL